MDQNQNPAPAPQTNIPPPFTLPPSVTSVPSVSADAKSAQTPVQNPATGSKKKWVKIGVIAGLAIVLIGILFYFGKDYLFKGQLDVAVDLRRVACESELGGLFKEAEPTCIANGKIYIWSVDHWELRPEEEVGPVMSPIIPEEEVPAKDIRIISCKNAPPDGLSGTIEGELCSAGGSLYSWNGSSWILFIPPEGGGPGTTDEGSAGTPGEGLAEDGGVCDYDWGPWGECINGKKIRSGSNASCDPALIFPSQVCSTDAGSGDSGAGDAGSSDAGSGDTGSSDAGAGDTGSSDTGIGTTGAGSTDVGFAGAGSVDSGSDIAGSSEESDTSGLIAEDDSSTGTDGSGGDSESGAITGTETSGGGTESAGQVTAGVPAPTSSGGPQGVGYGGASSGTPRLIVNGAQTQVSQITQAVRGTEQNASQSGVVEGRITAPSVAQANVAQAGSGLHGAYIQGQTGPGLFLYPFMLAGANALYFWRKKRKAGKR